MAEYKQIRNGTPSRKATNPRKRKSAPKRRKRNPVTTAKVTRRASNPVARKTVRKRSNPTRIVANKRKRKRSRRRNGILSRNGFFGNTKDTTKSVISLLAGLIGTKVQGTVLTPIAARALAPVGLSNFAQPVVEGVLAVTLNQWVARKVAGEQSAKFVMIGGVTMAVMSLIQQLLPQTSAYNPFATVNVAPLMLTPAQAQAAAANQAARLAGVGFRPAGASGRVINMPRFA